jgi:hypothetical protein
MPPDLCFAACQEVRFRITFSLKKKQVLGMAKFQIRTGFLLTHFLFVLFVVQYVFFIQYT